MSKLKVYVVGKGTARYINWIQNAELVHSLIDSDLVLFTGGEDVDPSIYKEPKNQKTFSNIERDRYELEIFKKAVTNNKHIIGICRGSQFLCAVNGGRLVQHQENKNFMHNITTSDGREIPISSTHHQAMYPYDMNPADYKLLAYTEGISKMHEDGLGKEISERPFKEVEICYFPKTKSLGIQGHPEMMDQKQFADTFEYLDELLKNHLNDTL